MFEQSSKLCDFAPEEDMLRLQRCLKRKAKDAVKSILHLPNQLENVLNTLALSFGRPGLIIKGMISKVKNMPSPKEDRMESVIEFSNSVKNLVATMQTLKCVGHMTNPQLVEELLFKLPSNMRMQWGMVAARLGQEEPNLKDFSQWLEDMAFAASYLVNSTSTSKEPAREKTNQIRNFVPAPRQSLFTTRQVQEINCTYCAHSGHAIYNCGEFLDLAVQDRNQWVKENKLCFSCLKFGHSYRDCKRKKICGLHGCQKSHNRILHWEECMDKSVCGSASLASKALRNGGKTGHVVAHSSLAAPQILLRVLPVTIHGPKGSVTTHALFDEGSSVTLLDAELATMIGVNGERDPLQLRWTDNSSQTENDSMRVTVLIQGLSLDDPVPCKYEMKNVRTIKKLSLPLHSVDVRHLRTLWTHLGSINIPSMTGVQPKILIGQDNCQLIISREVIEGPPNAPVFSRPLLGWSMHGKVGALKTRIQEEVILHTWESNEMLHALVKESFKTENFGVMIPKKKLISETEERALRILEETTIRVGDRWETGLLWKNDNPSMPESYSMAKKRLLSIEKQMAKGSVFAELYK